MKFFIHIKYLIIFLIYVLNHALGSYMRKKWAFFYQNFGSFPGSFFFVEGASIRSKRLACLGYLSPARASCMGFLLDGFHRHSMPWPCMYLHISSFLKKKKKTAYIVTKFDASWDLLMVVVFVALVLDACPYVSYTTDKSTLVACVSFLVCLEAMLCPAPITCLYSQLSRLYLITHDYMNWLN
jgi:hypothetical protein